MQSNQRPHLKTKQKTVGTETGVHVGAALPAFFIFCDVIYVASDLRLVESALRVLHWRSGPKNEAGKTLFRRLAHV